MDPLPLHPCFVHSSEFTATFHKPVHPSEQRKTVLRFGGVGSPANLCSTEDDPAHSQRQDCPCSGSKHTDNLGGILSGWTRKSKIYFHIMTRHHLEPSIYDTVQLQYVCLKANIHRHDIFTVLPFQFPSVLEHRPEIIIFRISQRVVGLNFSSYD